ncbi:hypothetical protein BOX15_Mlig008447g2, partial [Macrostomum lignano]
ITWTWYTLARAMSKRNPTSELNHENWDQEDEKEDAGRFKTASQDVLKGREIRVAKRRAHDSEGKGTGGLFKSFTGFTGFGAQAASATTAPSLAFNFSANATAATTTDSLAASSTTTTAKSATPAADPNAAHLAQLKALNQSVLRWIQSHVADSPYCVLTPVFRDYERHLADIERRHPYVESSATANSSTGTAAAAAVTPTTTSTTLAAPLKASTSPAKFNFSAATTSTAASAPTTAATTATTMTPAMPATFSFNSQQPQKPVTDGAATTATFFFGASAKSTTASSTSTTTTTATLATSTTGLTTASSGFTGFKFNSGPGAALPQQPPGGLSLFGLGGFAAASAAAASSSQEEQEDEEYEPPKPETREIREDGAVFSQKCKLFYMAAGEAKQWKEKGVGCVHVKPAEAEGGSRAQLIVRADNTLGTIMLNTLVTKDMKLSVAKNNLSLACPPNPPMPKSANDDRRIVPFLVRLKTEADAKELLAKIDGLREA